MNELKITIETKVCCENVLFENNNNWSNILDTYQQTNGMEMDVL